MVESGALDRVVWTQEDFDAMSWHDATVHGIGFDEDELWAERLLLDLDYIVSWVKPTPPDEHYSFLVAPATLVLTALAPSKANSALLACSLRSMRSARSARTTKHRLRMCCG